MGRFICVPGCVLCVMLTVSLVQAGVAGNAGESPVNRLGGMKTDRILILGNSITRHGPNASIGWTNDWGMAASSLERDFSHVLRNAIAGSNGGRPELRLHNIAEFERNFATCDLAVLLKDDLSFRPDVVVVAIGENVPAEELRTPAGRDGFRKAFTALLAMLAGQGRPAILVRSCFWADPVRDSIMRQACEAGGGRFVDISALARDEANYARAERTFANAGVAAHPGDKGMRAIAGAILNAMRPVSGPEAVRASNAALTVYAAPAGAPHNDTYSVQVRTNGGSWQDLFAYDAVVDHARKAHISFVSFDSDFQQRVEVKVVKNLGTLGRVTIRPEHAGLAPVVNGNTITFALSAPGKFSVEVDGNRYDNLFVFANANETEPVSGPGPGIHYFGPGTHDIGGGTGTLHLATGDRVYIAGGAIVYGNIEGHKVRNITISGRGILCGSKFNHEIPDNAPKALLLNLYESSAITVKDIILLNTVGWNVHLASCEQAAFDNLKILSWTVNSDGINPRGSSHVTISDCFVRNNDDCISIKLDYFRGNPRNRRGCHDIRIRNCTFWTDHGRVILIGPESVSLDDKVFDDIQVKNIDVLYCDNFSIDWAKGVLAINCGDDATVRQVCFEDIRVGDLSPNASLINLRVGPTTYSDIGRRIEDITFRRVTLMGPNRQDNVLYGWDGGRQVDGVRFVDLVINGRPVRSLAEGGFRVNPFTTNVTFEVTAKGP